MLKKIFSLALVAAMVLSLAACGKDKATSSKKGGSDDDDYVTSGGINADKVDEDLLTTDLAKKDFGGKSFTFFYWYEINEIINRKVAAFNDAHNAKVEIKVESGNFEENIAKSIASGTPYDMIANHDMFFPQSIFADIYEPLQSYIDERDYFNPDKPENGGLSKVVNDHFAWGDNLYAAGSAKAVYGYIVYYNKKMFADSGLEDPYQLWKDGKWTWDKFMEMGRANTDIAEGVCWMENPRLVIWLNLCGVSSVKRDGKTFAENLGDNSVVSAINKWQQLMYGDEPITLTTGGSFKSGKAFTIITYTDAFTSYAKAAKSSSAFGKDAANLGVVPVPTGLTAGGTYPGHAGQGYSAAKGASEPSLPACYALFESRVSDSDVGSSLQLPAEIRNYVDNAIATNGFVGFDGLADSEGTRVSSVVDREIGIKIRDGADVASTVAAQRSVVTRIINDCLSNAK